MKTTPLKILFTTAMLLLTAIAGYAKFTPAGPMVKQRGVTAKVVDQRNSNDPTKGRYGYIKIVNPSGKEITVNFIVYGEDTGKPRKVVERKTVHFSGQGHNEVFDYGKGMKKGKVLHYDKYLVAIEVIGIDPLPGEKEKEKTKSTSGSKTTAKKDAAKEQPATDKNAGGCKDYNTLLKKAQSGIMSQDDYAAAIKELRRMFDSVLPELKAANRASDNGDYSKLEAFDRKYGQAGGTMDRFSKLAQYIDNDYNAGKLNDANKKAWKSLEVYVTSNTN